MSSPPDGQRAARLLVAIVVAGLLGGTAAAFALTEQLKLEHSPVLRTRVGKLLGPTCRCNLSRVPIDFSLRKRDRVSVFVVDSNGRIVRTLVRSAVLRMGRHHFSWDGRDDAGQVVPEGTYKPRLHLAVQHRTILMPNPITVDPTAPRISRTSVRPRAFSPDGDRRRDLVYIRYRLSERARALLYVNGKLRVELRRYAENGRLSWSGRVFGRQLPAGSYRLSLRARDLAGNLSAPVDLGVVRIRYIDVRPHVLHAPPGARIGFRVSTDAKRYRWRLGSGGGSARPGLLVLHAPTAPGRYRLVVTENGHAGGALLIVGTGP